MVFLFADCGISLELAPVPTEKLGLAHLNIAEFSLRPGPKRNEEDEAAGDGQDSAALRLLPHFTNVSAAR